MNMWTSAIFGAVILTIASAQGPPPPPPQGACGCAPAPVVIQLSCNGGGVAQQPPPPPTQCQPPPPPTQGPPAATWAPTTDRPQHTTAGWAYTTDYVPQGTGYPPGYDEHSCDTDDQGYFIAPVPGGFPPGLRLENRNGTLLMHVPDDYEWQQVVPSHNFDGRPETLGFGMPPVGTPHYNMIMCWPINLPTGRR